LYATFYTLKHPDRCAIWIAFYASKTYITTEIEIGRLFPCIILARLFRFFFILMSKSSESSISASHEASRQFEYRSETKVYREQIWKRLELWVKSDGWWGM